MRGRWVGSGAIATVAALLDERPIVLRNPLPQLTSMAAPTASHLIWKTWSLIPPAESATSPALLIVMGPKKRACSTAWRASLRRLPELEYTAVGRAHETDVLIERAVVEVDAVPLRDCAVP